MRRALKWLAALVAVLLVAFLFLRTPDTDRAAMIAKYGAPPSQFVGLRPGLTVHYRDEGPRDAPAILLLHGSNADLHTWDAWTAALTDRYRVVRFDQIGHGLTGAEPRGDYSPQAFDDTIERLTAKLGVAKFALAGNSMGGGNALHYALNHGDRLTTLILVDSGGAPPISKQPSNIGFSIARTPVLREAMLSITPRMLVEQSLQQSVWNQAVATPAAVDRYWELLRFPGNRQATLDRFDQGFQTFTEGQLGKLKMPVLILWGAHDQIIPTASGQWFQRAIPGSTFLTYSDAGHLPMEEAAAQSVADLRGWIEGLAPG